MSDPAKYRPEGELDEVRKRDALDLAIARLHKLGVTEAELQAIRDDVEAEAQDAYDFADASPLPDPAHLYDYTYAPAGDASEA